MDEAPKSYRERQKEARRIAREARKALEAERRAAFEKIAKARYDARKLVKKQIRDRGEKPTDYTLAEIHRLADALI
jgi:hypothetical protein